MSTATFDGQALQFEANPADGSHSETLTIS